MANGYISSLLELRRTLDNRIDNEIDECLRGRADSARLKSSMEYVINESHDLRGTYKKDETSMLKEN